MYVVSEGFPDEVSNYFEYDTIEYLKKLQSEGDSNKNELIIVKDTNHYH